MLRKLNTFLLTPVINILYINPAIYILLHFLQKDQERQKNIDNR